MTPYSIMELRRHWFKWLIVSRQHQAITWTCIDKSSMGACCVIHLREISLLMLKTSYSSQKCVWKLHIQNHSNFTMGSMRFFFWFFYREKSIFTLTQPLGVRNIQSCTLTHWGRVTHICVGKLTIIGINELNKWIKQNICTCKGLLY